MPWRQYNRNENRFLANSPEKKGGIRRLKYNIHHAAAGKDEVKAPVVQARVR